MTRRIIATFEDGTTGEIVGMYALNCDGRLEQTSEGAKVYALVVLRPDGREELIEPGYQITDMDRVQ